MLNMIWPALFLKVVNAGLGERLQPNNKDYAAKEKQDQGPAFVLMCI